jgi:hypothetical protein
MGEIEGRSQFLNTREEIPDKMATITHIYINKEIYIAVKQKITSCTVPNCARSDVWWYGIGNSLKTTRIACQAVFSTTLGHH